MLEPRSEKYSVRSSSEEETERFAVALGGRIERGTCISLTGPLGCGKSVVARGICAGLGVEEPVISPTFILCEEYAGRLPVVHCDLYRLDHERDLEELGVFERIGDGTVVLVEWGDRSPRIQDLADVVISLELTGGTERRIDARYRSRAVAIFGER